MADKSLACPTKGVVRCRLTVVRVKVAVVRGPLVAFMPGPIVVPATRPPPCRRLPYHNRSSRRSMRRSNYWGRQDELSHIANERDDCWVPWIRTYSPERARMGTDTDCVHPTIVPLEGVCGGSITGDATMEQPHIANRRDDCQVPWIRTYSPERARMWVLTLTVCTRQLFLSKESAEVQ
jgi:hypothetical protein